MVLGLLNIQVAKHDDLVVKLMLLLQLQLLQVLIGTFVIGEHRYQQLHYLFRGKPITILPLLLLLLLLLVHPL
jgi:hypothetical protein